MGYYQLTNFPVLFLVAHLYDEEEGHSPLLRTMCPLRDLSTTAVVISLALILPRAGFVGIFEVQ
jgi:hypothetical protein